MISVELQRVLGNGPPLKRVAGFFLLGLSLINSAYTVGDSTMAAIDEINAEVLVKSTTMWNGTTIPPYGVGQPEISVVRVTIPQGQALPMHYHPYATAGVLLSGKLVVHTAAGETAELSAGDGLVELINQAHAGANVGDEPAIVLVVYAGIEGEPVTVLAEHCSDDSCPQNLSAGAEQQ
jgi:quercetin dioxygenase-like cupin family protein